MCTERVGRGVLRVPHRDLATVVTSRKYLKGATVRKRCRYLGSGPASTALPPCYLSRYNGDALSRHPSRTVAKMRLSFGVSDAAAVGLRRSLSAKPWGRPALSGAPCAGYIGTEVRRRGRRDSRRP
jgi:hypothetical protein